MMMRHYCSDRRAVLMSVFFFYLWFFVFQEEEAGVISPDNLDKYRSDLASWVQENEEDLRAEQINRRSQVKAVCEKYGLTTKSPSIPPAAADLNLAPEEWNFLKRVNWLYMYIAKKESLVWCKVPKAGSSTWTFNYLKLAGIQASDHKIHKLLRDYFPKPKDNRALRDTYRFMVVRHPFERILSAFRDKLESLDRDLINRDGWYFSKYGKAIVSGYREDMSGNSSSKAEPTWREFVTYLLDTPLTKFDEHWMPMWMLCSPCVVRYDAIAKMESFSEDTQYIISQAGLQDVLSVEWKHRTGTVGNSEKIVDYYSQLTKSEIVGLYYKYQLDFELYGYDPDPFFEIARP